ncbi:type II secretion system protein GspL [Chitinivorax sp. B]|uniref:type II secretion system protein GspL n=1 Tax=Chitinivorax sp. B TaxID=2502235 RepID=UPI0010F59D74|nr:type II secretion system protein GspL [Chitinivorax sp. B]
MHRLRLSISGGLSFDEPQIDWVATQADGRVIERGHGDPGNYRQSRLVELILPAAMTLATEITLPTASRKQAAKVVPFALEERLMATPEQTHIALGIPRDKLFPVMVVGRPLLKRLLDTLQQLGMKPVAAYSMASLLPLEPSVWHGCIEQQQGYVRTGPNDGFSFDATAAQLPSEIQLALKHAVQAPSRLIMHVGDVGIPAGWLGHGLDIEEAPLLDWGAAPLRDGAINLLQGEFGSGQTFEIDWKRFKPSIWLAGTALIIYMGSVIVDWSMLSMQHKALTKQMHAELRKVMPVGPIIDPLAQAKQLVVKTPEIGNPAPESLLGRLLPLAPLMGDATAIRLDYSATGLKLDCRVPSQESAEALLQRLKGANLPARLESVAPAESGGMVAKLVIAGRVS